MTVTFKGFDPDLGKKVAKESSGFVVARANSSRRLSDKEILEEANAESPRPMDAQEQHEALMKARRQK